MLQTQTQLLSDKETSISFTQDFVFHSGSQLLIKKMSFLVKPFPQGHPPKLLFHLDTSSPPTVRGKFFPLFKDWFLPAKLSPSHVWTYGSIILSCLLIISADSLILSLAPSLTTSNHATCSSGPISPSLVSVLIACQDVSSLLHLLREACLHFPAGEIFPFRPWTWKQLPKL